MNFASWPFIAAFLPGLLLLFAIVHGPQQGDRRMVLLIGASLVFYGLSGLVNLAILLGSIAVNYLAGSALTTKDIARNHARFILWLAVASNLALLMGFKIAVLDTSDGEGFSASEAIYIPLALSFVTFQQIGFVAGCYRRQIKNVTPMRYIFFVTFFPQLIMGPIMRYEDIDRQLTAGALTARRQNDIIVGLAIFAVALAKKTLIADPLSVPVDRIFMAARYGPISAGDAWFAIVGFQLQLFFDFTAYAEMAIGLGRMFGIAMPINFDRPLFAHNRFDLWRRWHISFVMFMRTNVFLPLVRHWRFPIPAALAVTGMLSGLWHGLGWTFLIWGLVQTALLLAVHYRNTRWRRTEKPGRIQVMWLIASTFVVTTLVGALFRAPTLESARHVYGALIGINGWQSPLVTGFGIIMALTAAIAIWVLPDISQIFRAHWTAYDMRPDGKPAPIHPLERALAFHPNAIWGVIAGVLIVISVLAAGDGQRFVYVQF
jgi:alginate O-acetyltransferase complex protein AlgI